jgi:integrase/recombinase XerC
MYSYDILFLDNLYEILKIDIRRFHIASYADSIARPPRTLTELEQHRLLKVTGEHRSGFRDHVIFALALGTALREHELAALNVGDVLHPDGRVRRRIALRVFKRSTADPATQEVFLPDSAWYKLGKFMSWKRSNKESLEADAPLFISRRRKRISTRTLRYVFRLWQSRAGFDRTFNFHSLRHTALTNVYRSTRDIRLVQRLARHKSVDTTTIYAAPSDEDIVRAVRELPC